MLFLSETHRIFSQKVMRTFGWDPSDEDLKDMVNVIDQVNITLYLQHINLYLYLNDMVNVIDQVDKAL